MFINVIICACLFQPIYWRYDTVQNLNPKDFRSLTGLSQSNFEVLYEFLGGDEVANRLKYNYKRGTPKKVRSKLCGKDNLLLALIRLRTGFRIVDLALCLVSQRQPPPLFSMFGFSLCIYSLDEFGRECVSRHQQPKWKIAKCFKAFKNFGMVLDTTSIHIQTPYHYRQQGNTHSPYKGACVVNFLVGIRGGGSISYVSDGFEGGISDRSLLEMSGLKELLEPGDLILVDRGFNVQDKMDEIGVKVLHPPFLGKRTKLTREEVLLTRTIAVSRIHVERAIRKVKCFHLLKRITNKMLPIVSQLFFVAACISNFDPNNVTM